MGPSRPYITSLLSVAAAPVGVKGPLVIKMALIVRFQTVTGALAICAFFLIPQYQMHPWLLRIRTS